MTKIPELLMQLKIDVLNKNDESRRQSQTELQDFKDLVSMTFNDVHTALRSVVQQFKTSIENVQKQ